MALDHDGLFAVIGKYVKTINTVQGYITALDSAEDEIFAILEDEGLQIHYADPVSLPSQFDGFQSSVASWISSLIANVQSILLDRDYVVDQLNLYQFSITDVLNALYDYMVTSAETIESSVVTFDTEDVDKYNDQSQVDGAGVIIGSNFFPVLFVSRTLDGVSAPGNNVPAHVRYDGIESQLARSATIYAELINNSSIGGEVARLYSGVAAVEPYGILTEDPGVGPDLQNPESNNLIPSNYDFSEWEGTDDPSTWSVSGTITTDYIDASGNGNGPLRLKTQAVTVTQKLENLQHSTLYFIGILLGVTTDTETYTVTVRLKKLAGTLISGTSFATTFTNGGDNNVMGYHFFRLPTTVDLTDVYLEIAYTDQGGTSYVDIEKVVVSQATYWNGLAWAWWPSHHLASDKSKVVLGHKVSIDVANNNNGVFQTFFRKAFGIQLPTADSPTIADTLAT